MNILPKKRWHVRTRENIARVRKDEQEAAAEAEEKRLRVLRAEKEARTNLLRQRAQTKYGLPRKIEESVTEPTKESYFGNTSSHVNFFEDLEEGKIVMTKTNAENELEEKEKREKYEKQIGYLTYLGQDTVEATGNIPWYEKVPDYHTSSSNIKDEKNLKSKLLQDPLRVIKTCLSSEEKSKKISNVAEKVSSNLEYKSIFKKGKQKEKKKKIKKKSKKRQRKNSSGNSSCTGDNSESSDERRRARKKKSLDLLRVERLMREKLERERTEKLLNKIKGKTSFERKEESTSVVQQKYNSQYNPELAKQNYSKTLWSK